MSPLIFIIVMEALLQEFRVGCPWELLYADDLVIIAETLEELEQKLRNWKKGLEEKGLKVNAPKTKVMHSRHDVPKIKVQSVTFPCGVCYKGGGANSILCTSCNKWVHKRGTSIKGKLTKVDNFVCRSCTTPDVPDDVRL